MMEMESPLLSGLGRELEKLKDSGAFRTLPEVQHSGKWIVDDKGHWMLNLSSNDYLGLAADNLLYEEFMRLPGVGVLPFSSSSSRLLTGNSGIYSRLEDTLASLYGRESALVLSSGYHMNTGILPALCDSRALILADKLVHASLIDGIRLSPCHCIRYRHQDYSQLESIIEKVHGQYSRIFIVTESIFSMDGDLAPLQRLVGIRRRWNNVVLYVDEAHAVGVRGKNGLGLAEEAGCLKEIDLICGTFGKALASTGAFVICDKVIKDWLVNKMRTLIFTTAIPPVNLAWTQFIVERLSSFGDRRDRLAGYAAELRAALADKGISHPSESHIVPMIAGTSEDAVMTAEVMRRKGFYVLPIRPPTVPEGTSRLRFSLTAALDSSDVDRLAAIIKTL